MREESFKIFTASYFFPKALSLFATVFTTSLGAMRLAALHPPEQGVRCVACGGLPRAGCGRNSVPRGSGRDSAVAAFPGCFAYQSHHNVT